MALNLSFGPDLTMGAGLMGLAAGEKSYQLRKQQIESQSRQQRMSNIVQGFNVGKGIAQPFVDQAIRQQDQQFSSQLRAKEMRATHDWQNSQEFWETKARGDGSRLEAGIRGWGNAMEKGLAHIRSIGPVDSGTLNHPNLGEVQFGGGSGKLNQDQFRSAVSSLLRNSESLGGLAMGSPRTNAERMSDNVVTMADGTKLWVGDGSRPPERMISLSERREEEQRSQDAVDSRYRMGYLINGHQKIYLGALAAAIREGDSPAEAEAVATAAADGWRAKWKQQEDAANKMTRVIAEPPAPHPQGEFAPPPPPPRPPIPEAGYDPMQSAEAGGAFPSAGPAPELTPDQILNEQARAMGGGYTVEPGRGQYNVPQPQGVPQGQPQDRTIPAPAFKQPTGEEYVRDVVDQQQRDYARSATESTENRAQKLSDLEGLSKVWLSKEVESDLGAVSKKKFDPKPSSLVTGSAGQPYAYSKAKVGYKKSELMQALTVIRKVNEKELELAKESDGDRGLWNSGEKGRNLHIMREAATRWIYAVQFHVRSDEIGEGIIPMPDEVRDAFVESAPVGDRAADYYNYMNKPLGNR